MKKKYGTKKEGRILFIGTLKYFLKKDKKAIIESDLISGQQKKFLAIQKKLIS